MRSEVYSTCFVCRSVGRSVSLSVTAIAATSFISACNQRHLWHSLCVQWIEQSDHLPGINGSDA